MPASPAHTADSRRPSPPGLLLDRDIPLITFALWMRLLHATAVPSLLLTHPLTQAAAPLPPQPPPLASLHLTVSSLHHSHPTLFTVQPATGDRQNLSRSPTPASHPAWSPDGQQWVFVAPTLQGYALLRQSLSSPQPIPILASPSPLSHPTWQSTPDGERLVVGIGPSSHRPPSILSLRPDGTDPLDLGPGTHPVLAPNGQSIAFLLPNPTSTPHLGLMHWNGSHRRLLPVPLPQGSVLSGGPDFAPDSSRLVVALSGPTHPRLVSIPLSDNPVPVHLAQVEDTLSMTDPSWSPDGKWVAFRRQPRSSSNPGPETGPSEEWWVVGTDGSSAQSLTPLTGPPTPDGGRAAWTPAIRFPEDGARPVRFPALETSCDIERLEDELWLMREPRRSRDQVLALRALLPPMPVSVTPSATVAFPRLRQRLAQGDPVHVVQLGDALANDLGRSGWIHFVRRQYPDSPWQLTTIAGNLGTPELLCREERVARWIAPLQPNLVLLLGQDLMEHTDSLLNVVRQLREHTEADVAVLSKVWGGLDALHPDQLLWDPSSAYAPETADIARRIHASGGTWINLTRPWTEGILASGQSTAWFQRDPLHPNELGEAFLALLLQSWFAPDSPP